VPTGSRFRAVVTDLDGTVVRPDGDIDPSTVDISRRLAADGIPVIAATARTPAAVETLTSLVPHLAIAVCSGGALGWAPWPAGRLLWRESIAAAVVGRVVAYVTAHLDGAGIAAYDGHRWRMTEAYFRQRPHARPDPVDIVPASAIGEYDACAMAIAHAGVDSADLARALESAATELFVTYSTTNLVDIGPAGVHKATGVARALAWLGVAPADAIAFGDMPNDLPLFALCGHAVAVGNAHPDVLAAAATVTACVHADGFARALLDLGVVRDDPLPPRRPTCGCPPSVP